MPNKKVVYLPYYTPSGTGLIARILQVSTKRLLDYVDGVFRESPAIPDYPLIHHTAIYGSQRGLPSLFGFEEDRQTWSNGEYQIYGYETPGYEVFAGCDLYILNDIEVSQVEIIEYAKFVKDVEEGNWELKNNKWIYYAPDGVTVLREFNLTDQHGHPTMTNIFKRERV